MGYMQMSFVCVVAGHMHTLYMHINLYKLFACGLYANVQGSQARNHSL